MTDWQCKHSPSEWGMMRSRDLESAIVLVGGCKESNNRLVAFALGLRHEHILGDEEEVVMTGSVTLTLEMGHAQR